MLLAPGCPRCTAPVTQLQGSWSCSDHGPITPLWRPGETTYDGFGVALQRAGSFPTYLPWPLSPGWTVSDFGVVAGGQGTREGARATVTCSSGTSALDGPVDVFVVAEEAGTGLGARVAGVRYTDPQVADGPPTVRVRIGSQAVPLWDVPTTHGHDEVDRSVVAGEAAGRWLWLVVRPASALLLFRDDWILRDVGGVGPMLLEVSFGGAPPVW